MDKSACDLRYHGERKYETQAIGNMSDTDASTKALTDRKGVDTVINLQGLCNAGTNKKEPVETAMHFLTEGCGRNSFVRVEIAGEKQGMEWDLQHRNISVQQKLNHTVFVRPQLYGGTVYVATSLRWVMVRCLACQHTMLHTLQATRLVISGMPQTAFPILPTTTVIPAWLDLINKR